MDDFIPQLEEFVKRGEVILSMAKSKHPQIVSRESDIEVAQRLYKDRRLRDMLDFDDDLFGEPGWDILLDLFVRHSKNEPVSIKSACIAASVPHTTALRWVGVLEHAKLIERREDARDARRSLLVLTDQGFQQMRVYLNKVSGKVRS